MLLFQIEIDVGMGKEDGDNRVMANPEGRSWHNAPHSSN